MSIRRFFRLRQTRAPHDFLRRLARDRRGNTIAIIAASLIPLTAMIGSGVDISRAYMAKTRLQSACDAAALAARRAMMGDSFTPAVSDEAVRFFNFNFPQGMYQTAAFMPTVSRPTAGQIRVAASTTIPTAIMGIFGFTTLPLDVTCDANQNFVNTDVMLVLDTTGSMFCTPEEPGTCGRTSEIPTSRIVGLRDAVMSMYDALLPAQTQLQAAGMRLRYGIVPYSSSVNVGRLIRTVNPAFLAGASSSNTVNYQSRVANYSTPTSNPDTPSVGTPVQQVYSLPIGQADCAKYGQNQSFLLFSGGANPVAGGGPPPTATTSTAYSNNNTAGADWGYPGGATVLGLLRSCRRWVTTTTASYVTRYGFTNWTYRQEGYDNSAFNTGSTVGVATDNAGTVATAGTYDLQELAAAASDVGTAGTTWNGCIEERETVSTIDTSSNLTIPPGAWDLNPDFIPNSEATRWRAMRPHLSYLRNGTWQMARPNAGAPSAAYYACPTEARRMQAWARGDMQTYVNSLTPSGGTYHDIGMIWGTRMLSTGGIFGDGCTQFAGMPCTRHIIFMTDGELQPNTDTYTAYGVETLDQRVTGSSSANRQFERHLQRFKMMCNQARSMNISIWVIAFGTSLSQDMIDCASNASQASTATNRQQLIDRFTAIGQNIGALRLSQ